MAERRVAFAAFMYDYNGNVTLYWVTDTAVSSARIYWQNDNKSNTSATAQRTAEISLRCGDAAPRITVKGRLMKATRVTIIAAVIAAWPRPRRRQAGHPPLRVRRARA